MSLSHIKISIQQRQLMCDVWRHEDGGDDQTKNQYCNRATWFPNIFISNVGIFILKILNPDNNSFQPIFVCVVTDCVKKMRILF